MSIFILRYVSENKRKKVENQAVTELTAAWRILPWLA